MPLFNTKIQIQEEGSNQGSVDTINFVGSSVTAAVSGATATITATGGGGGAAFRVLGIIRTTSGVITIEAGSINIASAAFYDEENAAFSEKMLLITFTTPLASGVYPVISRYYNPTDAGGAGTAEPFQQTGYLDGCATTGLILVLMSPLFGVKTDPSVYRTHTVLAIP